ncbi:bacterio-opsin activator domain-containing protein [Haloplanus salilacus]|uniref:bacterio-opsin activator domain-containing protein n=1 Tax=Haloplanus salilacus TaxID=2949994 RepID=UPI0030D4D27D
MGSASPSLATVREVVESLGPPGTPVTTAEVAAEFDCTARTVYNKLDALVEDGAIETKKVGARGRVWWQPPSAVGGSGDRGPATGSTARADRVRRRLEEERDMFADGPAVVFRWTPDADAGWPVEYVTENVEDVLGYTPEAFVSGAVTYADLLLDEDADRVAREVETHTERMADRFSHDPYRVRTRDGETKWVEDTTKIVRDDDGEVVNYLGYLIDITERKCNEVALQRTNDALHRLTEASRELLNTDTAAFDRRAAAVTEAVLDVDHATVWRYDGDTGELLAETTDDTSGTVAERSPRTDWLADPVREAFLANEVDVVHDVDEDGSTLGSYVLLPLGRHGVVCAGSTDPDRFDRRWLDLAETLGATIEAAWDRVESERRLADRNDKLQALDRLNSLIREIDQALVEADTVDAIDEAVCETLAAADEYAFAWIGERDLESGAVVPREWAGVDEGYLRSLEIGTGASGIEPDPIAAALERREVQVVSDVAIDSRATAWRDATLERGARSCIAIPLVYNESLCGVLAVYSDRPQPDGRDHTVLTELGETIAHAIDAVETKRTLLTDDVTEVTVAIRDAGNPFVALSRATGGELEFDGLVPRHDGGSRLFWTARDVATGDVCDAARSHPDVTEIAARRDDADSLFDASVAGPTVVSRVVDGGGVVRSLTAAPEGTVSAVVDLPTSTTVRSFVEHLRTVYPEVDLVKRRTRDRPIATRRDLRESLADRLTDRQWEVLETAYQGGFFESPRVRTGEELAETLGIAPSTFSYHLREAERRLSAFVFERV